MLFRTTAVLSLIFGSASAQQTIADIVAASRDHTVLEAAVRAAPGIAQTLNSTTDLYTVFAPTDNAFDAIPNNYLEQLLTPEWQNHLVCFLTSHVIAGTIRAHDFPTNETEVRTLSSYNVTLLLDGTEAFVDEIPVAAADINATNGVIHILDDRPILPPCVSETSFQILAAMNFSTLVSILDAAQIDEARIGPPFTIFAPTNEAFAKIDASVLNALQENEEALTGVLLNHVVAGNVYGSGLSGSVTVTTLGGENITATVGTGGIITIGNATVTMADILASNGVIHVVDTVLIPTDFVDPRPTNLEVVLESPDHEFLATAVRSVGGLADTLNALPAYTLFAPTDTAFEMLGDYASILRTPSWQRHLVCVLSDHVVPGPALLSTTITNGETVTTLDQSAIAFNVDSEGVVTIENNITISIPDILTSDGVVHVIDGVILPDCVSKSIYDRASETADLSTLKSLIDVAGLNGTLSNTIGLTVFAPTNSAFAKLDPAVVSSLQLNVTALRDVLTYHVLDGVRAFEGDLVDEGTVETLEGSTLAFALSNGEPAVNGIAFDSAGVLASNGVVYIIQDILMTSQTFAPATAPTTAAPATASVPTMTMAPVAPSTMAPVAKATGSPFVKPTNAPVMKPVVTPPVANTASASRTPTIVVALAVVAATTTMGYFL